MSTEKQIKANRQNAQKSTGPKTDEGKAAVSQNAVKHGLFAESVIKGENQADYEAFHDQMLAELAPVGMVENMLAGRIVSLWWRLRRAERMQNQAIEDMIGRIVNSNQAKRDRECYYIRQGIYRGDPRMELDDLPLGRIAIDDWKYSRVLDRMLMYERRMENSMIKLMKELKRFQTIRRIELQDKPSLRQSSEPALSLSKGQATSLRDSLGGHLTAEDATRSTEQKRATPTQAIPKACGFDAATRTTRKKVELKKQSQFAILQVGAKSYLKRDYGNNTAGGDEENKANQTCPEHVEWRQFPASEPTKGTEKTEQLVTSLTVQPD